MFPLLEADSSFPYILSKQKLWDRNRPFLLYLSLVLLSMCSVLASSPLGVAGTSSAVRHRVVVGETSTRTDMEWLNKPCTCTFTLNWQWEKITENEDETKYHVDTNLGDTALTLPSHLQNI